MSDIKAHITSNMKDAMRAKDKLRLGTIRMLLAAIQQREIDDRTTLDDAAVLRIINKQIKQRRDSITQFHDAGRDELAEKEQQELEILETYLPAQMSDADVKACIEKAIADSGASSMKDMGKVMGLIKPQLEGKTDMGKASQLVKTLISN
ncbi:MAG: glutamyl-tRNA amidotransferase [Coxiella sp. (in: Bacteria)]|nr:MAG: glutamyl-tRNA amidotransferase [Coxiella sp. (in: g-proteobacteria)]